MAVIQKTLFAENLDKYNTFVTDTDPFSKYFKITELADTFTGGKNAFLIQGSNQLVSDTLIKIEIKDSQGNIIYYEPGEGIVSSSVAGEQVVTEYYEGVSKVVAVHIYPDTTFGPCTITILGELSEYYNEAGTLIPIPENWQGTYNVKWQKQVTVNPKLANTTKIRFYKRPTASITETLSPIYTIVSGSKVESNIVSSFANVTLSKLDTFAGDVKRIKVYRTSEGDISDYDMIQDILVESKELLTSYELTGSVVGEAGFMTSEVLDKLWSHPTLTTQLTSSRVDNGVKLNGSGYFTFTSSLNLSENSVYEFGIDAFYSASTPSNMGIYVSGSNNGEVLVGTLVGIEPTKNLKDSIFQFTLPLAEPTASLYLSQSQSEWHIGNLSLKLTQDTAFSPSDISFVTSMPTVVGNETYNFKFEFYDVNSNYVPVAVTASALFTGGNNNIGGTLQFISSSASASYDALQKVSSSISGTAALYSSSADTTITTLSGSVDTTIVTLSGSVSGSITTLSGSVSASLNSLSSSVSASNAIILSSSFAQVKNLANGQYSGSFIGDTVIYSPSIGGQQGYIKELFTVGDTTSATINLDARTSTRKIYIGTGTYNNTNTPVYLDSTGQFSLKDKLTFDTSGNLSVNGTINVTGGNAATQTYANNIGTNAAASASVAQTAAINQASAYVTSLANGGWTAGNGTFITATSISSPTIAGNAGYISGVFKVGSGGITLDGVNKTIYIGTGTFGNANTGFYADNNGNFSLGNQLTFTGGNLAIAGAASIGGTTATTVAAGAAAGASALQSGANISSLTNNVGYQDNGSAKTAGSVGGWTIGGSSITSNNGQTILYNNGIISLTDGSSEKILITKDSLATSDSSTTISISGTSDTGGTSNYSSFNYYASGGTSATTAAGTSGTFTAQANTLIITVPYNGTGTDPAGTQSWSNTISNFKGVTYVTSQYLEVRLYRASDNALISTKNVNVFYTSVTNGNVNSYAHPPIPSGNTSVAFSGLTSGTNYYIQVIIGRNCSSSYIAFIMGSYSVSNTYTMLGIMGVSDTIYISSANEKTSIGVNGLIASSAGGFAKIGSTATVGATPYSGAFLGNVRINGALTANSVQAASDIKLKTNIVDIDSPLVKISRLYPKSFTWNDSTAPLTDKGDAFGFIAQDVQPEYPFLVKHIESDNYTDGILTVDYTSIIALNTSAIKQLLNKIEELEERILELENQ